MALIIVYPLFRITCLLAACSTGIPCVASFHTDILDLFRTHNANWFQKWCALFKERVDSYVLESCATTSQSFSVRSVLHTHTPPVMRMVMVTTSSMFDEHV